MATARLRTWPTLPSRSSACHCWPPSSWSTNNAGMGRNVPTRYQNFRKSGWYLPDFSRARPVGVTFTEAIEALFAEYHASTEAMFDYLKERTERPAGNEGGGLPPHPAGACSRRIPLPAPAGDQHLAGTDCERAYARKPDLPPAFRSSRGGSPTGRAAEGSRLPVRPGMYTARH